MKVIATLLISMTLFGCDGGGGGDTSSNSSSSDSGSDTNGDTPTPVEYAKPVANHVSVTDTAGKLQGTYAYSDSDDIPEGKSLLYWRDKSKTIISNGSSFNIDAAYLNKMLYFCVLPVSSEGMQGDEQCSSPQVVGGIQLTPTVNESGTLEFFNDADITPAQPDDYNLIDVSSFTYNSNAYIRVYRTNYTGYNINDISTYKNDTTIGVANFTDRTFLDPIVKITLTSGKVYHIKLNTTLNPFTQIELDMTSLPFTVDEVQDMMFIDPNPLFRLQIDAFSSPKNNDNSDVEFQYVPYDDLPLYERGIIYNKYYYNRLETLSHFYDYFSGVEGITGNCQDYYFCNNPAYAIHGYSRILKSEVNTDFYVDNDGAMGAGDMQGTLQRLTLTPLTYYMFSSTFIHEHDHNLGYDHESGMTYGWDDEFEQWTRTQSYYDMIDYNYKKRAPSAVQTLNEQSDYLSDWKWLNNKTIIVRFLAANDSAAPLTSFAILAEDEQDPTEQLVGDVSSGYGDDAVGITGHENNDFSISSVYQLSADTLLITLNHPMRYMGNTLAIMAKPTVSESMPQYLSIAVNNTNDIAVKDSDVGALMVDALTTDYKEQALFNGSDSLQGESHSSDHTMAGLDDGTSKANSYNFALSNYQSWGIDDAISYCQSLGSSGLAKISTDDDSLSNLQNKYLNDASIIALDDSGNPAIFKPGDDATKGQLIACSLN
ncbi:TPA: hypothetical protein ACTYBL_005095 [Klebsiella aerogenes]